MIVARLPSLWYVFVYSHISCTNPILQHNGALIQLLILTILLKDDIEDAKAARLMKNKEDIDVQSTYHEVDIQGTVRYPNI